MAPCNGTFVWSELLPHFILLSFLIYIKCSCAEHNFVPIVFMNFKVVLHRTKALYVCRYTIVRFMEPTTFVHLNFKMAATSVTKRHMGIIHTV